MKPRQSLRELSLRRGWPKALHRYSRRSGRQGETFVVEIDVYVGCAAD